jgi:para-aminobenzoate synthetase component 1
MKTFSPNVVPLPWQPDAAEHYFSLINHLPWAMLLHSGHADHACNRFDILVADPLSTLVTRGEQTVITDAEGEQLSID